jgi:hypothetical protein
VIGTGQDHRLVLTSSLAAPAGHTLDRGLLLTYSLDLPTLIAVPAALVLGDDASRAELLSRPAALLEALHRARDRILVVCQRGAMHAPRHENLLFSLLEPMIREVAAPHGGAFHPKVWLLRFVPSDPSARVRLRMVVGSRNLTMDRSWDLAVTLEGEVHGGPQAIHREFADLLRWVTDHIDPAPAEREWLQALVEQVRRVHWEVPAPWDSATVEVLGLHPQRWAPPFADEGGADELVVVSPFVDADALRHLAQSVGTPPTVIATPEALDAIDPADRSLVGDAWHLIEDSVTESGEEDDAALAVLHGLHAKAFFARSGWHSELVIGSANATRRAMLAGTNIEVGVRLRGRHRRTGLPASLLTEEHGIRELLTRWDPATPPRTLDPQLVEASAQLDALREALTAADLRLRCDEVEGGYRLTLLAAAPLELTEAAAVCWPVTIHEEHASPLAAGTSGQVAAMGVGSKALLTRLIAFELRVPGAERPARFVRNLPADGMPDGRHRALLAAVLHGREGFLAYLRYLLGDLSDEGLELGEGLGAAAFAWRRGGLDADALLETMVRALARDPERLQAVRELLASLDGTADGEALVPPSFRELWAAIEPHLPQTHGGTA